MQEQQVEVVDAELAGALVERVQRGVIAVVADPDLRLKEDVIAGDARAANAFADLALVAVGGGCVDQPVADTQRRLEGRGGLLGRRLEDAESESGHRDAVVQFQSLAFGHHSSCAVGRMRISLSDTLRGRETAKAMIWAMSSGAIEVA
jgi:hypothetical protein